jgi:hypothetical protein
MGFNKFGPELNAMSKVLAIWWRNNLSFTLPFPHRRPTHRWVDGKM